MANEGFGGPPAPGPASAVAGSPIQWELLAALPQAAVVTDAGGVVVAWNPAAERLYGYSAEEALGRCSSELVRRPGPAEGARGAWELLRKAQPWSGDLPVRRRDGGRLVARVTLVPLLSAEGDLAYVLGLSEDVSARRTRSRLVAEARERSEQDRARLAVLVKVGEALAETHGVSGRLEALCDAVVPAFADFMVVGLSAPIPGHGSRPVVVRHRDRGDAEVDAGVAALRSSERCADVLLACGESAQVNEVGEELLSAAAGGDACTLASLRGLGLCNLMAVPLRAAGRNLGAVCFGRTTPEPWGWADRDLGVEIGRRGGMLVYNALLLDAEREARRASEGAQEQLRLLADLTASLSTSLDLDSVLDQLAQMMVPAMADIAAVDLHDTLMGDRLAAVAASTPGAKHLFEEAERILPRRHNELSSLSLTLRSGMPTRIEHCEDAYLREHAPDPGALAIYRELELSSILVVPLKARDRVLGAVTLLRSGEAAPRYGAAEEEMALEMGRRAALAVDNARLYTAEHRAALTLQRSLLPELEAVDHLEAAALYLPATRGAGVGGDWYDLFRLPDGSAGVAVGDAMGHDMRAAASMGQLRSVVRSYAYDRSDPGEVLDKADRLVQRFSMARLATAFYAQVSRLPDGDWRLRYANAGHPYPVLRCPGGMVELVDDGSSLLIGAPQGRPRPTTERVLPAGTTMLLYTDGLVDGNDRPIDEGMGRLVELMEELGAGSPGEVCSRVAEEMVGPGRPDDVALLAVKLA